MESTFIQASNEKYDGMAQQEREESKEEAPVASTSKAQSPTSKGREEEQEKILEETVSPSYRIPRIQRDTMENLLNLS
ncbi:hypothetical protein O181_020674 [Austropuccinia psidii MF-1]|uniref:Uncharacterized protein n=1 Tax=Austropuccinia psidii MF-1 TaxID=1389203 RepID=A0A9Q3C9C5_9BASI|nr:hypothetical protein [Austropuccinia psidii MF-1]